MLRDIQSLRWIEFFPFGTNILNTDAEALVWHDDVVKDNVGGNRKRR